MSPEQYAQLVALVEKAEAEVIVDLEHIGFCLKDVRFNYDKRDLEYGWIGERSWKNVGAVGYVHPMKNSQYVKTFKTLAGAKRNFLAYWKPRET